MSVSASTRGDVSNARASTIGYLPGLDGLRALAVIAVIVYHADHDWLPGGFLGVEVFFVISGYLITQLLVREHERSGGIDLVGFWGRRARRLLPALALTLLGVLVATALLRADAAGQVRGDILASAGYVANWYQIWVGAGYTAAGDFAPLRHLWSLAIEEQFYLVWPIVVMVLLGRNWSRLAIAVGATSIALVSVGLTAALAPDGPVGDCATSPDAFWTISGRCISITDSLYLSTFTRGSGLLLGAAFALVATHRRSRGWTVAGDVLGAAGMAVLVAMTMTLHFSEGGADPLLFRGGLLVVDLATLALIAAITRPDTITAQALSARTMLWIGTRSYGLYLYHWPVFQLIRRVAGRPLTLSEFVGAVALTAVLAEVSYRAVEMPIRRSGWREYGRHLRAVVGERRWSLGVVTLVAVMLVGSTVRVGTADQRPNAIEAGLAAGAEEVVSIDELLAGAAAPTATEPVATTATTTIPTTTTTTTTTTTAPALVAGRPVVPSRLPLPETTTAEITTTAVETTTTVPAPPSIPMLAIGDSVMLGAAAELSEHGWVVNARISRQMIDTVPELQQLRDAGLFGDVVLLHLGTNGAISNETLDAALATLADVPLVILVTVRANRSWAGGVSEKVRARASDHVVVLDWAVESRKCPGRCFEDDGIHLRGAGRQFYADLVTWTLAVAQRRPITCDGSSCLRRPG